MGNDHTRVAEKDRRAKEAGGTTTERHPNGRAKPRRSRPRPLAPFARGVDQVGELVWFSATVAKEAVLHPRGFWGEVRDQMYSILRMCFTPLVLAAFAFGFGPASVIGLSLLMPLGAPERFGSVTITIIMRVFGPFLNAIVVAGVVGTAMTSDFGARKVREELDALEVLGVKPLRVLVVPRILALIVMASLLSVVACMVATVGIFLGTVIIGRATPAAFFHSYFDTATVTELATMLVKSAIYGLVIGCICAYKGVSASGGSEGVGRAVNQAVVIIFLIIWVIEYVFSAILLGLNPGMLVNK